MALYRAEGVVLRRWKLGEADRIIVFATAEHGKVRAVARGVRKTKAKLAGKLDPPAHVALQLYETRGDLDIVTQVETINRFDGIREDLNRLVRAMAMLEASDQVMRERDADPALFTLIVKALETLAEDRGPLVMSGFMLKVLSHEGLEPFLDACVSCGAESDLVAFDIGEGGILCNNCRRGRSVTPEALRLLRMILGGGLGKALDEPEDLATVEVEHLVVEMMEYHIERRLKSLTVLPQTQ